MRALMKKEFGTFFKIPVFIVNAGFGLVLFIILVIMLILKLDGALASIADEETGLGLAKELITNNLSLIIFALVTFTAAMTSITCSMISLEGKNISILKSLPVKTKTILMSKVYTALLITVPVLILGDIALFIKFRTNILEAFLLVLLSILMPLANDILGIIINLKYPKLDWDNPAEAIKQSTSSFIATFGGMVAAIFVISFTFAFMGKILPLWILLITTLIMAIMNVILYLYLSKKSVKDFDNLSN
jgi:ABC-2 type transport system permease protein